jgi:uncharacterized protein (DUF1778 family)
MLVMASQPISIRLDEDVRDALERDAAQHGVGLATYLRDLATERARAVRKSEIRAESRVVGDRVRVDPEARAFYESWGIPGSEG